MIDLGQIIVDNNKFTYNESEHKSLLEILNENKIEISCCRKIYVKSGNIVCGGIVSSLSDKIISVETAVPIGDIELTTTEKKKLENDIILNSRKETSEYGVTIEIGDYCITVTMYNLLTGFIVARETELNKQIKIAYSLKDRVSFAKNDKEKLLHQTLLKQLNCMIGVICIKYILNFEDVKKVFICGNTPMLHFATGIDFIYTDDGDFSEQSLFGIEETASSLGFNINKKAQILFAPCVDRYVGGNILSVINAYEEPDKTLFIDFGSFVTIALINEEKVYVNSSIGENYSISGVTAPITGAVTGVMVTSKNDYCFETVDNTSLDGITLSGLINLITFLIDNHKINIDYDKSTSESYISFNGLTIKSDDIYNILSLKDYCNSAISKLLDTAKLSVEDIKNVIISNSFGEKISIHNLFKLGILSEELYKKSENYYDIIDTGLLLPLMKSTEMDKIINLSENTLSISL